MNIKKMHEIFKAADPSEASTGVNRPRATSFPFFVGRFWTSPLDGVTGKGFWDNLIATVSAPLVSPLDLPVGGLKEVRSLL